MEGLDPKTYRIMRGVCRLYREGCVGEGMVICRRVLQGDPENAKAWHNQGYGHWKSGQIRESLRSNDRALALWPEYPEAWNNRGMALGVVEPPNPDPPGVLVFGSWGSAKGGPRWRQAVLDGADHREAAGD